MEHAQVRKETLNLCMKCSLGISNFFEAISSLSHSVVFLYFFALIAEEGFLISSCYSLELCMQECFLETQERLLFGRRGVTVFHRLPLYGPSAALQRAASDGGFS